MRICVLENRLWEIAMFLKFAENMRIWLPSAKNQNMSTPHDPKNKTCQLIIRNGAFIMYLHILDQRLCSIWNIEKMLQFYVIFKGIYKVWGKWRILWRHNALTRCRIMLRFIDTWSPTLQVIKTAFATYTECFWFFQNISGPNKAQSESCPFIDV